LRYEPDGTHRDQDRDVHEYEGAVPGEPDRQLQAIALLEASLSVMDPWLATQAFADEFANCIVQVDNHRRSLHLTHPFPPALIDFARRNLGLAGSTNALPALGDAEHRHRDAVAQLEARIADADATATSLKETLVAANTTIETRLGAEDSEASRLLADTEGPDRWQSFAAHVPRATHFGTAVAAEHPRAHSHEANCRSAADTQRRAIGFLTVRERS